MCDKVHCEAAVRHENRVVRGGPAPPLLRPDFIRRRSDVSSSALIPHGPGNLVDGRRRLTGEWGLLFGKGDVVVNILHVVTVVEHVEKLLKQGQVFRAKRPGLLREKRDFLRFKFDAREGRENG